MSTSSARSEAAGAASGASGINALSPRPSAGRFSAMLRLLYCCACRRISREDLARKRDIRLRAARFGVVEKRGHTVARRFSEPDVPRDDGGVDAILKERADILRDLLSQIRPFVVHRHQHAGD